MNCDLWMSSVSGLPNISSLSLIGFALRMHSSKSVKLYFCFSVNDIAILVKALKYIVYQALGQSPMRIKLRWLDTATLSILLRMRQGSPNLTFASSRMTRL